MADNTHWLTRYDADDGEPYGEVCYCAIGADHDGSNGGKGDRLFVVLTNNGTASQPRWKPDWDGEVHIDPQVANEELLACVAAGNEAVLAEVRLP